MHAASAIVFEPLFPNVSAPVRATEGSAGHDVSAYVHGRRVRVWRDGSIEERTAVDDTLIVHPGEIALVPLGFRARLPDGYEAQLRLRSSVAFTRGLIMPNAPGTVDSDYPDEWLVMVKNISHADAAIAHGERIAQVVLARYEVLGWALGEVRATTRAGGVGSTGS
jgi:dUTP pyrophosphatase